MLDWANQILAFVDVHHLEVSALGFGLSGVALAGYVASKRNRSRERFEDYEEREADRGAPSSGPAPEGAPTDPPLPQISFDRSGIGDLRIERAANEGNEVPGTADVAILAIPKPGEYRVWFGTDRFPRNANDASKGFSALRGGVTRRGYCDVYVPRSHKIGSIGSSLLIRTVTWTDDRLKLRRYALLDPDPFWAAVAAQLARVPQRERQAVVFLHGYNVAFEEAALRAAQIGYDLGVTGAMAFFSWPSKGTAEGYPVDEGTIDASAAAITDFLVDFATRTGADAVHVIAHSMGNRALLRSVADIAARAEARSGTPFGQIILAAPDVDADLFRQLAAAYRRVARRTTLYVSAKDKAVGLSKWLHAYPRVGFTPPVSVFEGIDTVSVTSIDLSMLGHGYVAEERPVLNDMHALIFEDRPPERRFGLAEARTDAGERYWEVRG